MGNYFIINIGRQFGSGCLLVADLIAKKLNIEYFDKNILNIAAQKSGICENFFSESDEKKKFDFLGRLFSLRTTVESEIWNNNNYLSGESLFKIQSEIIEDIAKKQSAIFVGRCADYILRDNKNCLNVFLTADLDDRIRRIAESRNISEQKAKALIERSDKKRENFYNYYTDKKWGDSSSYDLCLNTSYFGIDNCAEIIIDSAKRKKLIF